MAAAQIHSRELKPHRSRRLALLVYLALITAPFVAHAVWRWSAARSARMRIEALHAAGERILPVDFQLGSDIDDRQNGAIDLAAAAAIVDDRTPERETLDFLPTTRPINPKAWPYLDQATQWFQPALRRIEIAETKPRCEWREHQFCSPVLEKLQPRELIGNRTLAWLLTASTILEHHRDHDEIAVRRLRELLYVSAASEKTPMVVAHLCALSISRYATERIEQLAPDFRVGPRAGEAAPDDVRKLIVSLLDETAINQGLGDALAGDRMTQVDSVESILHGMHWEGTVTELDAFSRYAASPELYESESAVMDFYRQIIAAFREADNFPDLKARLSAIHEADGMFVMTSIDSMTRLAENHFMALADRRLAATALAIRLYQLDHHGRRPNELADLVPRYLPTIPRDPLASPRRPLSYRHHNEHPVLYSVGLNGSDDNGGEAPMPEMFGNIDEWHRLDRVFYLSLRPRQYIYIERKQSEGFPAYAGVGPEPLPPWERPQTAPSASPTMENKHDRAE